MQKIFFVTIFIFLIEIDNQQKSYVVCIIFSKKKSKITSIAIAISWLLVARSSRSSNRSSFAFLILLRHLFGPFYGFKNCLTFLLAFFIFFNIIFLNHSFPWIFCKFFFSESCNFHYSNAKFNWRIITFFEKIIQIFNHRTRERYLEMRKFSVTNNLNGFY